ncbi:MAG: hypothetical protein LBR73_02430 [Oscillospiraceae bacterium]|jgi:hypothetical protein|nr:hypothetical protein [Oscillospiraceae bacterium]
MVWQKQVLCFIGKTAKRMVLLGLAALVLFTGLLTLAFCIPDRRIAANLEDSIAFLRETNSVQGLKAPLPVEADGHTVEVIEEELVWTVALRGEDSSNPLQAAMVPARSRYWYGYLVFLRPALVFLNIAQIRSVSIGIHILLLGLLLCLTAKKHGIVTAVLFTVAYVAYDIWAIPFSFRFRCATSPSSPPAWCCWLSRACKSACRRTSSAWGLLRPISTST